jgi:hypothetical protein
MKSILSLFLVVLLSISAIPMPVSCFDFLAPAGVGELTSINKDKRDAERNALAKLRAQITILNIYAVIDWEKQRIVEDAYRAAIIERDYPEDFNNPRLGDEKRDKENYLGLYARYAVSFKQVWVETEGGVSSTGNQVTTSRLYWQSLKPQYPELLPGFGAELISVFETAGGFEFWFEVQKRYDRGPKWAYRDPATVEANPKTISKEIIDPWTCL